MLFVKILDKDGEIINIEDLTYDGLHMAIYDCDMLKARLEDELGKIKD